jgi:tetratricopeptide (TPR) repeat protein
VRYFKLESLFLPLNAQPLTMAGYCYASLGDTTNALKYFLLARNKSPGHFWIDHDLGLLYYRAKDLDRAYAAFQRVIQRDMPSLFEAAVLSPMTRTPASQRKVLVAVATDFAVQLKGKSYQMKVMIDFERQLYPQAMTTALAAVEDPLIQNKSLFLLYAGAAAYRAGYFEQAVQLGRFALDKDKRNEWAKALLILSVASLSGSMAEDAVFFERFTGDPGLFPRNTAVVLHPWAAYILPGKEAYL